MSCPSFYFVGISVLSNLNFYREAVTPPPTPSPVKPTTGKKRPIGTCESDNDDVFIPRFLFIYFL